MKTAIIYYDTEAEAAAAYERCNGRPDLSSTPPTKYHFLDDATGEIREKWAIRMAEWATD